MKNLKVSMKLIISFMVMLVLALAVGLIGILGMNSINTADNKLYDDNVIAISAMGAIREALQESRAIMRNYIIYAEDSAKIQEFYSSMQELDRNVDAFIGVYESTIRDSSLENEYYAARNLFRGDFHNLREEVRKLSLEPGGDVKATELLFSTTATTMVNTMVSGFDTAMSNNEKWAKEQIDANTTLFKSMLLLEIVILAIAAAAAVFFALYISGLISKPLVLLSSFMNKAGKTGELALSPDDLAVINKYGEIRDEIGQTINGAATFVKHVSNVSEQLVRLAGGDLTVEVTVLSQNDTLGVSLNKMADNLNDMFANIQTSATQVSSGAKQVADGSQALAQGATEQAASIQQLSSSIADIATKTKTNAQTADRTSKLSVTIRDNAIKGSGQMDQMIEAVKEINDASQSISKIIKTIDDIAFQTNILALNAAVEAARAGQHGKGFAVVAEEVRNLASKSAEAAKDTGDMIQNSMEKAEFGSRIASETATSLKDIVTGINESSKLIAEIAMASEEQSLGISQINTGVDQVAQVVQQNSATAEQSAAASEEMSGQSDMLQQLIAQFQLRNDVSAYRSLPGAAKAPKKRPAPPPSSGSAGSAGSAGSHYSSGGDFGKY